MPGGSGRVLVVDDSQIIRQLIKVILELEGFEVMTAADGVECLERATLYRPDVITLDARMPRMDGVRAAESLRGVPATSRVPLLLVSADPPCCPRPPVDAVVGKPFEPTELLRQVWRLRRRGGGAVVQLAKSLAG